MTLRRFIDLVETLLSPPLTESEATGHTVDAYHGTPWPDFEAFRMGANRNTENETAGLGFWFTNNPETASGFASKERTEYHTSDRTWPDGSPMQFARRVVDTGAVLPVKLRMRNPLVFRSEDGRDAFDHFMSFRDRWVRYIDGVQGKEGHWRRRMVAMNTAEANQALRDYLRQNGYDSIAIKDTIYDAPEGQRIDQYVILDPSQVRSRFAKFDPAKADSPTLTDSRQQRRPSLPR